MLAPGHFRSLHSTSAHGFLSVPGSVLKSSSRGSCQLPQAGCGWERWSEKEACLLLAGALRVSRRMKRCLSLPLRLTCSRDAGRGMREEEEGGEVLESWWRCSPLPATLHDPRLILHGSPRYQVLCRQHGNRLGPHRAVRVSV